MKIELELTPEIEEFVKESTGPHEDQNYVANQLWHAIQKAKDQTKPEDLCNSCMSLCRGFPKEIYCKGYVKRESKPKLPEKIKSNAVIAYEGAGNMDHACLTGKLLGAINQLIEYLEARE